MDFLDILIGFWGHVSAPREGGFQIGVLQALECTCGVWGSRGSVGVLGDWNTGNPKDPSILKNAMALEAVVLYSAARIHHVM